MQYRGYEITHDPPPIPNRNHDWQFAHNDYDGPEDHRCGTAPSLEAAKAEIDEQIGEIPQFCDLESGTIFCFNSEPGVEYEKVGDRHYRKGRYQINNVCLPISNRREGISLV